MKLGIYSRSLENNAEPGPLALLDRVSALGLDGCQFASPLALSPKLVSAELEAVRAQAASLGLYVELALGQINPYHFDSRPELLALGDGDMRAALQRLIGAARAVDCTEIMFTIGTLADRFSRVEPWDEQLRATTYFLQSIAPVLRDLDCHLCLKTHEEITSFEIVRLIEAVGPDVLGVCFDPVNVLVRIEDPLSAARRLRPYVRQLQIDDAILTMTMKGFERWLVPCGRGILDWPGLMALLLPHLPEARATIELHRAFFEMPIFDAAWLSAQPDLTITELVNVLQLVSQSTSKPLAEDFQTNPISRLEPTLAYVRTGMQPSL
jgi:sugar phosphate isomerase/epimerase